MSYSKDLEFRTARDTGWEWVSGTLSQSGVARVKDKLADRVMDTGASRGNRPQLGGSRPKIMA